ncbi:MAG: hypothetical protein ABJR05_09075 [Balneola sp.]
MSRKELSIVVIFLVGLNLFLAYSNYSKKTQLEAYLVTEQTEVLTSNLNSHEKTSLSTNYITNNQIKLPKKGPKLVVFIDEGGCQYCIEKEVKLLNQLHEIHDEHLDVYLLSNNYSLLKRLYNAKFDYKLLDRDILVSDAEIIIHNPVSFLIDNSGLIQVEHFAEKDNPSKSETFYTKMESFFHSL